MTIITNWYTMDNKEGVNFNQVQTISTTSNPDYPAPSAKLGDRVQGNNGSEWIFVQASATVTAQAAIAIAASSFRCEVLTSTHIASAAFSFGFAEFQSTVAAPSDYFWALLKANGGIAINCQTTTNKGASLYVSSTTPGALSSLNTGDALNGIYLTISTSVTGTAEAFMFNYILPATLLVSASS